MFDLMSLMQACGPEQDHLSMLEPGSPEPIESVQQEGSIEAKINSLLGAKTQHEVKAIKADAEVIQRLATQRLAELDELHVEGVHNLEHTLEGGPHAAVAQETLG